MARFKKIEQRKYKGGARIKNIQKYDKGVLRAIISANNHYAGFGPATVNTFREIMEIPQISLEQRNDIAFPKYSYFSNTSDESNRTSSSNSGETKQTSISDFLG